MYLYKYSKRPVITKSSNNENRAIFGLIFVNSKLNLTKKGGATNENRAIFGLIFVNSKLINEKTLNLGQENI